MAIHDDDMETKGFLNSISLDELQELRKGMQQRQRSTTCRVIRLVLGALLAVTVFFLGRLSVLVPGSKAVRDVYSPAADLVEYQLVRFDKGYGKNTSDGRRIVYGGRANEQIDAAWDDLYFGAYVRITDEEARQLDEPTAPLHVGGGHIMSLDVYHQLHCLNFLRMALQPDYYEFHQPADDFEKHLAHCVNDLRQALQCAADITPLTFTRTTLNGRVAYDPSPHFEMRRTCRNWDKINNWARERSLMNDPNLANDLLIV
ncbi:hypothetical protein B0T16DRAFT_455738 [Cercophora newfieldiana]|uniref:Cyclochlorotine biosynthesis protein O n=1 Tax=Cercophora newfieldiana TaxID=92897 RepID=A0AA39Y911_9PEZI|nr:hypothetical protein B0T16DRAFT_455738 [Cercophora newfieldiana]